MSKIIVALLIFFVTPVFASQMQTIEGANAFRAEHQQVVVRISVNPKSIANHEKSLQKIMQKITVVVCANGTCEFAKSEPGLGFYHASFKASPAQQKIKILVL